MKSYLLSDKLFLVGYDGALYLFPMVTKLTPSYVLH